MVVGWVVADIVSNCRLRLPIFKSLVTPESQLAIGNWQSAIPSFPRRDDTHDLSVGGQLTLNLRLAVHALDARTDAQGSDLEHQGIARNDRATKTCFFDPGKQNQLLIAIFDLAQGQHRADLGQRFDNKHAGHHGRAGKVTLEEWLVDTDLFDSNDSFAGYKLDDAVDEEKRIAMRQELLNRL